MCKKFTLVLGGASSGKSDISEKLCIYSNLNLTYLASAEVYDEEMRTKVEQHRTKRDANWRTIEEPLRADAVIRAAQADEVLLFDCASLWLTNHLLADHALDEETDQLIAAIQATPAEIVVVSNEVGLGIVPDNALARRFRIAQGQLNRRLASEADCVIGVMAGLPFALKGALPEGLA
ncbi:bifunctional adenosylcobinamide kinase/adenosylcobinamide-phosphate guanylyltransferase [Celeribacter litoreus]|uniref:bifunctional adenosylcobinamide kinase/adenosylcobinamide-phosphate guanylyltransferase n=1 Tax=Celeribacter litoreus TaxID=2876714 RepID=UPI001CC8F2BC|nr:bifunctional adenosylcobinamide kinase/adenosylcobinamide-phosphate guanylyltransferase [Celeribacter litoreus]MCA0042693.1 bifunctional adenosylcobinamide kinase/adenosylcobinamide-phosphate guanylyltransferase [Celeribacter litoreus]